MCDGSSWNLERNGRNWENVVRSGSLTLRHNKIELFLRFSVTVISGFNFRLIEDFSHQGRHSRRSGRPTWPRRRSDATCAVCRCILPSSSFRSVSPNRQMEPRCQDIRRLMQQRIAMFSCSCMSHLNVVGPITANNFGLISSLSYSNVHA